MSYILVMQLVSFHII